LGDTRRRLLGCLGALLAGAAVPAFAQAKLARIPLQLHLTINRKTAAALGLAIPSEFILRADELIE
jgi:hypothetical protein